MYTQVPDVRRQTAMFLFQKDLLQTISFGELLYVRVKEPWKGKGKKKRKKKKKLSARERQWFLRAGPAYF